MLAEGFRGLLQELTCDLCVSDQHYPQCTQEFLNILFSRLDIRIAHLCIRKQNARSEVKKEHGLYKRPLWEIYNWRSQVVLIKDSPVLDKRLIENKGQLWIRTVFMDYQNQSPQQGLLWACYKSWKCVCMLSIWRERKSIE